MNKLIANQLSDAYETALKEIRSIVGSALEQQEYCIMAEVKYIVNGKYTSFVTVHGNDGVEMQIKVPNSEANQLKVGNTYLFTGCFEVGARAKFGALQMRVHSFELVGNSFVSLQQQISAQEIIDGQYLNKYKDDFTSFWGKSYCKVALVTSPYSKAIADVDAVLKRRSGITLMLFEVKLNNTDSIVTGIMEASNSDCDVMMIVRGGGKETDFGVFDDTEVIKAIYHSTIPVITGLGHTSNFTLADQAADRSENTPTKAAQFLVDKLGRVKNVLKGSATQYQHEQVVRETNVKYQYTSRNSHFPNRKKKQSGLIVTIAIILVIMTIYYFMR
ncbi:exodeoxyribonuclease VII large subunit [Paenibacillus polymyxa]|uniref:exodeoxyribonuclease VII large subunit n=1 Tax=Paenibacillus polymyxa TaxID=1406 RepID=UPI0025B6E65E|nr:exodeoxyribonuclease VII large subunit [Paenibacillus polymyxa]MDN4078220.1 exodeoxyribonuclease VII large subunit [Paenibacillus polymyxa]MDN4103641.1 exodeoxyribonuclease VII large subunit [Paenibacillus polymyxa]MDN4113726.1 exodeoxyribonuclease VII large subunit [Paenibacillus polymyxa]